MSETFEEKLSTYVEINKKYMEHDSGFFNKIIGRVTNINKEEKQLDVTIEITDMEGYNKGVEWTKELMNS